MELETKELLTIPEFVTRYAISRSALYREVNAKRLRLVKRGRRSLISRKNAQEWLENLPGFHLDNQPEKGKAQHSADFE